MLNPSAAIHLGTLATGVLCHGVQYGTPLELALCTPVIGVQPQSSTPYNDPEFWSDTLRGVPIQMPWLLVGFATFAESEIALS